MTLSGKYAGKSIPSNSRPEDFRSTRKGIRQHNNGLVKEADATEFWSLTPETMKSGVVKFPSKAAA